MPTAARLGVAALLVWAVCGAVVPARAQPVATAPAAPATAAPASAAPASAAPASAAPASAAPPSAAPLTALTPSAPGDASVTPSSPALSAARTPPAAPEDERPVEVVVHAHGVTTSAASEVEVSRAELLSRPRRRPGDLIEAAPGLISVQHAGGGKANQYFLRGFDVDHGTDLLITVDGVPVNFPTHGHGQGYADLHFVIPELVTGLSVHKGPYYAPFGDFATAGALEMHLGEPLPQTQLAVSAGQFGIRRAVALVPQQLGPSTRVLLAAEAYTQDGPFQNPEDLQRLNLFARATQQLSDTTSLNLTWMSYAGTWNASGQIPLREVEAGRLDRFGTLDPTEGGATQRQSLALGLEAASDSAHFEAQVYGIRYAWRLYSNFTFFLEDPVAGDQIEQTDVRDVFGTHLRAMFRKQQSWVELNTTVGLQGRTDQIQNALYHDAARTRLSTQADNAVNQTSLGVYVDEWARFYPWLAMRAGARFDRLEADVTDHTPTNESGTASASLVSPKASLILSPVRWLDLFVNFGRGFHSNDARGATRADAAVDLMVPATGYEVGAKTRWFDALTLTSAVYVLDLDSEQVYVGDAGTTEPSAASRRYGLELTGALALGRWLNADAALTLNRAAYRPNEGNGGAVALAPTRTLSAGVSFDTPAGAFGSLRARHIGARPATEDGSIRAEGWTIFSALVGQRVGAFELNLTVDNLFDVDWREVQFATESRLFDESAPVEEIHFAPGWPFTASATLKASF